MAEGNQYAGGSETLTMRPLSGGIIRDTPSRVIPAGGFYDLENYLSTTRGLERRASFNQYTSYTVAAKGPTGATVDDEILLIEAVQDPVTGGQQLWAIGKTWIYSISGSGFTPVYRKHTSGFMSNAVGSVTVTGSGTGWSTGLIKAGDVLVTATTVNTRIVAGVTSDTVLTVTSSFLNAHIMSTASTYTIYRKVGAGILGNGLYTVDLVRNPNRLILASPGNELWEIEYGDTEVGEFGAAYGSPGRFSASCVAYWRDRVFAGCYKDGTDGYRPQRYRWTELLDDDDFSESTAYNDLIYESTPLMRLAPLGAMLVAMFKEGIRIGRPSNYPTLPAAFEKVNTGGIGLVGQRALSPYLDSIFFIGQDNFYALSNSGFEPIGSRVIEEALAACGYPEWCQVTSIPTQKQVWFGITRNSEEMEQIWVFDVPSKSWSRIKKSTYSMCGTWFEDTLAWDDWTTEKWEDESLTTGPSWASESGAVAQRIYLIENGRSLWSLGIRDEGTDPDGVEIQGVIESPDIDLNRPDEVKFFTRIALRARDLVERTAVLSFAVQVSPDAGHSWKSKGNLKIAVGEEEGYVNFRLSSSIMRFRLTSSSSVGTYIIEEITVDVKSDSRELSTRRQ